MLKKPNIIQFSAFCLSIFLCVFLAAFAWKIHINTGWTDTLQPNSPIIIDKQRVDSFLGGPKEYSLFFLYGENDKVNSPVFAAAIKHVTDSITTSGYFETDSIKSINRIKKISFNEGVLDSGPFIDDSAVAELDGAEFSALENSLKKCAFLYPKIVASDFSGVNIIATYVRVPENRIACHNWQKILQKEIQEKYGLTLHILDDVYVNAELDKKAMNDTIVWPGLSAICIGFVCFFLCGRKWIHVVGFFILAGMSMASVFGLIVLLGYDYGIMFIFIPILLIVTAGSDYPYFALKDHYSLPGKIFRQLAVPISLAALTTSISAASLGLSQIVQIKHFGIIASLGILLNSLYSLTVLPVFFYLVQKGIPSCKFTPSHSSPVRLITSSITHLIKAPFMKTVTLTVVFGLSGFLLIFALLLPWTDNYILDYFVEESDVAHYADKASENFGGFDYFKVLVRAEEGFEDLSTLKRLAMLQEDIGAITYNEKPPYSRVQELLAAASGFNIELPKVLQQFFSSAAAFGNEQPIKHSGSPTVVRTFSLVDLVGYVYQQWQGLENTSLPENQQAYDYLRNNFLGEIFHMYRNDLFDDDFQQVSIDLTMNSSDTRVHQEVYNAIKKLEEKYPEFSVAVGGYQMKWLIYKNYIVTLKMQNILLVILIVFAIVTVFFAWLSGSLRKGVTGGSLVLLPIVIGFVWVLAIMFLLGIQLNIATATVSTIGIGISVNFAVHLMYTIFKKKDFAACRSTIHAMFTDLATSMGFLFLLGSQIASIGQTGILIAVSVLVAFVLTLTLIPCLCPAKLFGAAHAHEV